jgi:PAS domain S-box-containing protein
MVLSMGFPGSIMLLIAAFTIAVSLNHLFLASRLKASRMHLYVFLTGLAGAAWFLIVFTGYGSAPETGILQRVYRYHLLVMQVAFFLLAFTYSSLIGFRSKRWLNSMSVVFAILILISLFLPDRYLFSTNPSVVISVFSGSPVTLLEKSITYWRLLVDLSVILAIFFTLSFLLIQLTISVTRGKTGFILLAVLLFILAGIDHMTDAGTFSMIYLLPLGYFLAFSMLSASSLSATLFDMKRNQKLMQQDRKWRMMASEMKLIILELNTLGQVKYANPYFFELTGFKKEDVVGKDWFEQVLPKSHTYEVQSAFIDILSRDFHPHYENPIMTKYHEERIISWYNVRTRDSQGKIIGSISIGIDITDHTGENEALETELFQAREMIERLEKELRAKDQ